jgi:hypothetical protein
VSSQTSPRRQPTKKRVRRPRAVSCAKQVSSYALGST